MSHTCGNTGRRQELPCINCDCESSARPASSALAWSKTKPTEKGVYAWRGGPSDFAMVLVHKRPSEHSPGGVLKGSAIGRSERHFYDGCAITDWHGEWIGPLPQD